MTEIGFNIAKLLGPNNVDTLDTSQELDEFDVNKSMDVWLLGNTLIDINWVLQTQNKERK